MSPLAVLTALPAGRQLDGAGILAATLHRLGNLLVAHSLATQAETDVAVLPREVAVVLRRALDLCRLKSYITRSSKLLVLDHNTVMASIPHVVNKPLCATTHGNLV